jgi:fructosamine-3-kinase
MPSGSEVREVIRHELGEEPKSYRSSDIGSAHQTFFVQTDSGKYVLKVSEDDERFQVEAPVIRYLNSECNVAVPELTGFDNSKNRFDFMYFITGFEPGENIDSYESESGAKFRYLSVERKKNLLNSAGRNLGKIHSQAGFDSFGTFHSDENRLEFREKMSWPDLFRKIIIEEQVRNFPERFHDLQSLVREFINENIGTVEGTSSPCLVHQDVRWPNMKVQGKTVSTIFDWERSISGHHEYDLFKAEESLIQVRSEGLEENYRQHFLDGYRKHMDLNEGWKQRRDFYRAVRPVEALWTFEGWTDGMSEERKDEMAEVKRSELEERIERYREDYA